MKIMKIKHLLILPFITNVAAAAPNIADIANNLIFGADILSNFLHAASIAMGVGFLIYSLVAFRNHYLNPKMVPLDRPIVYVILSIVLIAVPFLGRILEHETGRSHVQKTQGNGDNSSSTSGYHDIDAPLQ
jgi:hypothetical protein